MKGLLKHLLLPTAGFNFRSFTSLSRKVSRTGNSGEHSWRLHSEIPTCWSPRDHSHKANPLVHSVKWQGTTLTQNIVNDRYLIGKSLKDLLLYCIYLTIIYWVIPLCQVLGTQEPLWVYLIMSRSQCKCEQIKKAEFGVINATKGPRQEAAPQLLAWGMMTFSKALSKASRTWCLCLPTMWCPDKASRGGDHGGSEHKGPGGK